MRKIRVCNYRKIIFDIKVYVNANIQCSVLERERVSTESKSREWNFRNDRNACSMERGSEMKMEERTP